MSEKVRDVVIKVKVKKDDRAFYANINVDRSYPIFADSDDLKTKLMQIVADSHLVNAHDFEMRDYDVKVSTSFDY